LAKHTAPNHGFSMLDYVSVCGKMAYKHYTSYSNLLNYYNRSGRNIKKTVPTRIRTREVWADLTRPWEDMDMEDIGGLDEAMGKHGHGGHWRT